MAGENTSLAYIIQGFSAASSSALLILAWRASAAWSSVRQDIKHIRGQVEKTNGTVRNHERRISHMEGQHDPPAHKGPT